MPDAKPFSKDQQVGAGRPKRYRRKVASPKQWAAIRAEKLDDRLCRLLEAEGDVPLEPENMAQELHHLVSRAQGGDDVADNLVGVCRGCHALIENHDLPTLLALAESLTNAEYAYCVGKLGEGAMYRLFGVLEVPR